MRTRLHFLENLKSRTILSIADPQSTIVIYDRRLVSAVAGFRAFIAKYPHSFSVTAGENLKSLDSFAKTCERVHKSVGQQVTRQWTVLAVGGGSVGDFAGFFASVYRRGLKLMHLPTTWLAAVDSSHGGKTALNLLGAKNQIGTFYPASHTIMVHSVLRAQSDAQVGDALGEFLKIAIIDGGAWTRLSARRQEPETLWRLLPNAIESKLRIVRRDPLELSGHRQILNLGHTFGHVVESTLGLSHGRSVALGLLFALDFSEATGAITTKSANKTRDWLSAQGIKRSKNPRSDAVTFAQARRLLRTDKKRDTGDFVWFIVIRGFGKTERRLVGVSQILEVARHHGWIR